MLTLKGIVVKYSFVFGNMDGDMVLCHQVAGNTANIIDLVFFLLIEGEQFAT